jgi:hypothetical protein
MGEWIKAVQAGLDPRAAKPEPGPTAEAPAPKRETREEQTAQVLAEWEAGGNPGPKPEAAAQQARTAAFMAERRQWRREYGGLKYHRI